MIIQPATAKHLMQWPLQQGDDFIAEIREILNDPQSSPFWRSTMTNPLTLQNFLFGIMPKVVSRTMLVTWRGFLLKWVTGNKVSRKN